jgi:hypothetical protein
LGLGKTAQAKPAGLGLLKCAPKVCVNLHDSTMAESQSSALNIRPLWSNVPTHLPASIGENQPLGSRLAALTGRFSPTGAG